MSNFYKKIESFIYFPIATTVLTQLSRTHYLEVIKLEEKANTNFKNIIYIIKCSYIHKNNTCGSLCVARVKEMPVMLEFTSFQDTIMFHKRGRFGLEKVQNNEINVKVVLDMECGNI